MNKIQFERKKRLIILLPIFTILLAFGYLFFRNNSNVKINNLPLQISDFGEVKSHKVKNYCSYAATGGAKYCSNTTIVEVNYLNYKSPLSATHGWREVSSPFDVFVRNEQGQLVCAIRKEQHSGQAKQITFFTRPETAGDDSCTKV